MADPTVGNPESSRLFFESALQAGTCLGGSAPVVVSVVRVHPAGQRLSTDDLEAPGWGEAAAVATAQLREQPVVLVPDLSDLISHGSTSAPGDPLGAVVGEIAPPSDTTLFGLLLPASWITSRRHQGFRAAVVRRWQPAAVLYSTGAFPEVHPSEQLALLYLRAHAAEPQVVYAFRVPRTGDATTLDQELAYLLSLPSGATEHGYVLQQLWPAEASWRFDPSAAAAPLADDPETSTNTESSHTNRTVGDMFERVKTVRKDALPT
ncbi:hypothetical protein [Streptomyces sp. NPDC052107]|uniref:hypothetical protein n=1 Tax=Streptomyces sp. NPDC052107 TaxID=3155632 RepID=UPI0034275F80